MAYKVVDLLTTDPSGSGDQSLDGWFFLSESGVVSYYSAELGRALTAAEFGVKFGSSISSPDRSIILVPKDGLKYLRALEFFYSGSRVRATGVKTVAELGQD